MLENLIFHYTKFNIILVGKIVMVCYHVYVLLLDK